jgi:hypothetical protein
MRILLVVGAALLVATTAGAQYKPGWSIPPGDGLVRLAQLCDWMRASPEYRKPDMTNDECSYRFFLRGAFEWNHEKKRQELIVSGRDELNSEDEDFWIDLPKPAIGPTPTPTASPTSSPTVSPTASPTATPAP